MRQELTVSSKYAKLTFMNLCVLLWPPWHLLYCLTRQIPAIWYFGQVRANVRMFCICNYYLGRSTAARNFTVMKKKSLFLHIWHVSKSCGIKKCCLQDGWTMSLLKHHAPHRTPQHWKMYSSIITRRSCSYLCFQGTSSSSLLHPHPASCCCCSCCCSCWWCRRCR